VAQSVERRVPSAVRPDAVEDAVIVNAAAAADGGFPIAKRIPGKPEARSKIMVSGFPHPANGIDACVSNASRVMDVAAATAAKVCELRQDAVIFARCTKTLPAKITASWRNS